jgi:hypothetical protein
MNVQVKPVNLEQSPGFNGRAPLREAIASIANELEVTLSAWDAVDEPWHEEKAAERGSLKIAITYLKWILVLLDSPENQTTLPAGLAKLRVTAPRGTQGGHDGLDSFVRNLEAIADDIAPIAFALAVLLKHIAQSIEALSVHLKHIAQGIQQLLAEMKGCGVND